GGGVGVGSDDCDRVRPRRQRRERAGATAGADRDDRAAVRARIGSDERPAGCGAEAAWSDRDLIAAAGAGVVADAPDVAARADRIDGAADRVRIPRAAGGGHQSVAETADPVER